MRSYRTPEGRLIAFYPPYVPTEHENNNAKLAGFLHISWLFVKECRRIKFGKLLSPPAWV